MPAEDWAGLTYVMRKPEKGVREEVRAVAALLAVGVLLGLIGGTGALGASGNALVGVVGLAVAGAGNLVALGDTANVLGVTYGESELEM